MKTVPESLREAASIYEHRNAVYGDNYKHIGKMLMGMFPRGFIVQNEEEANRLHLIMHIASKLTRYCQNLKGGGHDDSLTDIAVYAMMALECDQEFEARRKAVPADSLAPRKTADIAERSKETGTAEDTSWRGTHGIARGIAKGTPDNG